MEERKASSKERDAQSRERKAAEVERDSQGKYRDEVRMRALESTREQDGAQVWLVWLMF